LPANRKGYSPVIHVYTQTKDGFSTDGTLNDVAVRLSDPGCTFWIDMDTPTDEEINRLQQVFSFHHLCIEDCMSYSNAPKLDEFDDYLFLVTHEAVLNPNAAIQERPEIDFFLGKNYLVSFHYHPSRAVVTVRSRCLAEADSSSTRVSAHASSLRLFRNSDFILQAVLDAIVEEYFPLLDRWEERITQMEDRIITVDGERPTVGELIRMKRELGAIRRLISPQRDVLSKLIHSDNPAISKHSRFYFQDVYDHVIRAYEIMDGHRDAMHNVLEAHYALLSAQMNENSNRINFVMQRLTIITTIFMPLSFIAGIYGMNFKHMPELGWPFGYFAVLGLMGAILLGMLAFFRRQKWL
jgi:magnesium transporter